MKRKQKERLLASQYRQLADLTLPVCGRCSPPLGCCSRRNCEISRVFAKKYYGITLRPLRYNPNVPYLGPNGCTVPPEMRPHCTMFVCPLYDGSGEQPSHKWRKRYAELMSSIQQEELRMHSVTFTSPIMNYLQKA